MLLIYYWIGRKYASIKISMASHIPRWSVSQDLMGFYITYLLLICRYIYIYIYGMKHLYEYNYYGTFLSIAFACVGSNPQSHVQCASGLLKQYVKFNLIKGSISQEFIDSILLQAQKHISTYKIPWLPWDLVWLKKKTLDFSSISRTV